VIGPHLPNFPYPASVATKARATARAGNSLNSNIRMYKYTPNQHFGPHYDDAVVDPSGSGSRSEWTLLIYLTGVEDGVKGGETVFYLDNKMKKQVKAPLNRGTALLHRYEHRSSQPPILVLTPLIRRQTRIRVFTSRGVQGREWHEVYPTLRCYVYELMHEPSPEHVLEMSFKRENFAASPDLLRTIILDGMHQPLLQAFPEYCVVKRPEGICEFKVENRDYFRSRNASSPYYSGLLDCAVMLVFPVLGAVVWQTVCVFLVNPGYPLLKPSLGSQLGAGTCLSSSPSAVRILEGNASALG